MPFGASRCGGVKLELLAATLKAHGERDFVRQALEHVVHLEVAALDGEGGLETGHLAAAATRARAGIGDGDGDRLLHTTELEIAGHFPIRAAGLLETGSLESHRRELFGREEVGGAEVLVAGIVSGVDAICINRDLEHALLGRLVVEQERAAHLVKSAVVKGDVLMLDSVQHGGVNRIDREGAGCGWGLCLLLDRKSVV